MKDIQLTGYSVVCFAVWFFCRIDDANAVIIRNGPYNRTALTGSDVTFRCEVIEQRKSDTIFWKKVGANGFTDVISYNENVVKNVTKYSVDRYFTLYIRAILLEDESWYECQAGVDRARALLNVTVMMDNMTLSWGLAPPFPVNTFVNLTCKTYHSRPPADIRWLYGQDDVTSLASSCSKTYIDGFGDSSSTLLVTIGSRSMPYRCVASLPGVAVARTEVVFPLVDGQTSTGFQTVVGLFMVIVCFIAVLVL